MRPPSPSSPSPNETWPSPSPPRPLPPRRSTRRWSTDPSAHLSRQPLQNSSHTLTVPPSPTARSELDDLLAFLTNIITATQNALNSAIAQIISFFSPSPDAPAAPSSTPLDHTQRRTANSLRRSRTLTAIPRSSLRVVGARRRRTPARVTFVDPARSDSALATGTSSPTRSEPAVTPPPIAESAPGEDTAAGDTEGAASGERRESVRGTAAAATSAAIEPMPPLPPSRYAAPSLTADGADVLVDEAGSGSSCGEGEEVKASGTEPGSLITSPLGPNDGRRGSDAASAADPCVLPSARLCVQEIEAAAKEVVKVSAGETAETVPASSQIVSPKGLKSILRKSSERRSSSGRRTSFRGVHGDS